LVNTVITSEYYVSFIGSTGVRLNPFTLLPKVANCTKQWCREVWSTGGV